MKRKMVWKEAVFMGKELLACHITGHFSNFKLHSDWSETVSIIIHNQQHTTCNVGNCSTSSRHGWFKMNTAWCSTGLGAIAYQIPSRNPHSTPYFISNNVIPLSFDKSQVLTQHFLTVFIPLFFINFAPCCVIFYFNVTFVWWFRQPKVRSWQKKRINI